MHPCNKREKIFQTDVTVARERLEKKLESEKVDKSKLSGTRYSLVDVFASALFPLSRSRSRVRVSRPIFSKPKLIPSLSIGKIGIRTMSFGVTSELRCYRYRATFVKFLRAKNDHRSQRGMLDPRLILGGYGGQTAPHLLATSHEVTTKEKPPGRLELAVG